MKADRSGGFALLVPALKQSGLRDPSLEADSVQVMFRGGSDRGHEERQTPLLNLSGSSSTLWSRLRFKLLRLQAGAGCGEHASRSKGEA